MFSGGFKILAWIFLLLLSVSASELSVTSIGVIGSGCQPGTAKVDIDNDHRRIRVRVDDFHAEAGPGLSYSANRKACRVTLGINVPEGYTFATEKALVNVAYSADSGVQLTTSSISYFQSQPEQAQGTTIIPGFKGETTIVNDLSPNVWSSCGGSATLIVGTDIRVSNTANRSGSGYINVKESWDGQIVWRKC